MAVSDEHIRKAVRRIIDGQMQRVPNEDAGIVTGPGIERIADELIAYIRLNVGRD